MLALLASTRSVRAAARTGVFLLKVIPTLPSRPLDFVTPSFTVEKLEYPTSTGTAVGDVYRPTGPGPHPAVLVCLGVVPFGVDHPQVPILGEALARAGFAALLYWSPHMRDFRLDPEDIENIALSYERLVDQPYVDETHSGLIGTCVGGSFALMAAAHPSIRDRIAFVAAFAPYGSLLTLARDIASSSRLNGAQREPWAVDQLTRRVFIHSVTARLAPAEAEALRNAFDAGNDGHVGDLSADGEAIRGLLAAPDLEQAERALEALPQEVRDGLTALSPINYLADIHAPSIAVSHDRDDGVVPVGESRQLRTAQAGRTGFHYTEFAMFQHADPTKRKLPPWELARQLSRFYLWLYAVFRHAVA